MSGPASPLHRVMGAAALGGAALLLLVLPFAALRLARDLRAVRRARGRVLTFEWRLFIGGAGVGGLLVWLASATVADAWFAADTLRLWWMLAAPPVIAVAGFFVWIWAARARSGATSPSQG
jgi:hypothetical protein